MLQTQAMVIYLFLFLQKMAVALPPINDGKNGTKKMPSYAESGPHGPPSGRLKPLRVGNKKERDLHEKRMHLRSLQRDLSKAETAL